MAKDKEAATREPRSRVAGADRSRKGREKPRTPAPGARARGRSRGKADGGAGTEPQVPVAAAMVEQETSAAEAEASSLTATDAAAVAQGSEPDADATPTAQADAKASAPARRRRGQRDSVSGDPQDQPVAAASETVDSAAAPPASAGGEAIAVTEAAGAAANPDELAAEGTAVADPETSEAPAAHSPEADGSADVPLPETVNAAAPDDGAAETTGVDGVAAATAAPPEQTTALPEEAPTPAPAADASMLLQPEPQNVMEVALQPQELKAGLAPVIAALPGKTTLPVLHTVLIETDGPDHVRLTATDLDTTVTRRITATVSEPGAVLVAGKKFGEIVREIPDGCTLTLRLKEDTLHVWCEATRTRYRLPTLPRDEFPNPPGIQWEGNAFAVEGATLGRMIETTVFAASTEETRPILNGVLWEFAEGEMGMVATNGHRLSSTHVAADTGADRPEMIIHPRALAMVARLPAPGATVQIARTENHIGFRGDGWEIITRLMEGPYPPYRQVLPQGNDKELVADKASLTAALRRMVIVASEQTHRVKFALGEDPMLMRMSVETSDVGTAHEDVAVEYKGEPLQIGFNALYLLELLRYIPAGEVRMTFKAAERAAIVEPVNDDTGVRTVMLVMPLRLL